MPREFPPNNIKSESHSLQYRSGINKFPSNSKIVRIFNPRGFIAVNKHGEVYTTKSNVPESMYAMFSII